MCLRDSTEKLTGFKRQPFLCESSRWLGEKPTTNAAQKNPNIDILERREAISQAYTLQ